MTKLLDEFKQLQTDEEKWKWVIAHQSDGIIVHCDNDMTYITIDGEEGYEQFDYYIGWAEGVFKLLDVAGINAEAV